jgi:hypothetical protein
VSGSLLVVYRCRPKGCLLLRVSQTPDGPQFYAPAHRLSDRYTRIRDLETEVMSGRNYIEILGPPRAPIRGRLDESAPPGLQLMCNHVNEWASTTNIRRDIDRATPGRATRVLWPRDMSQTD